MVVVLGKSHDKLTTNKLWDHMHGVLVPCRFPKKLQQDIPGLGVNDQLQNFCNIYVLYLLHMHLGNFLILQRRPYLSETGMSGCRPATTPIESNQRITKEGGSPIDREQYQRLVGRLIYLSHTRPDIAFAIGPVQLMIEGRLLDIVPLLVAIWLLGAAKSKMW